MSRHAARKGAPRRAPPPPATARKVALASAPAVPPPLTPHDFQHHAVEAALNANGRSRLIVAPTGSGKSIMAAELARRRLSLGRVLILTHVGELVEQNAQRAGRQMPGIPIGILAGKLARWDLSQPVIVANVATAHRRAHELFVAGPFSTVIVDEAHRLDPDGRQYAQTLAALGAADPSLVLFGLTATPWRDGHGHLAQRGSRGQPPIFETVAAFIPHSEMIERGFIVPVRPRRTTERLDLEGIALNAFGDYATGALDARVNRDRINAAAVSEVVAFGRQSGRRRWLVFAVSIDHAERLAREFRTHGVAAGVVSARTPEQERKRTIADFKSGRLTAIVNVAALTTGFDAPEVNLIALLRPTKSRVLYAQMLGRGARTAPGKRDCIVLDFAGSVLRLGAVEDLTWHGPDLQPSLERAWCCPRCETYNTFKRATCEACETPRPEPKASRPPIDREKDLSASDLAIGYREARQIEVVDWTARTFLAGGTENVLLILRPEDGDDVTHGLWFTFRLTGAWDRLATEWRRFGGQSPIPSTAQEALSRFRAGELRMPTHVTARPADRHGKRYWNVERATFAA